MTYLDCIFMWNVFSSNGLAIFLPRAEDISVWQAESCITSAIQPSQAMAMLFTLRGLQHYSCSTTCTTHQLACSYELACTSLVFRLKFSTKRAMSVACCSCSFESWWLKSLTKSRHLDFFISRYFLTELDQFEAGVLLVPEGVSQGRVHQVPGYQSEALLRSISAST